MTKISLKNRQSSKTLDDNNNPPQNMPRLILFGIGILNLGRGGFHLLAPDSGAGSVAGMNLAYPNRNDITFLLASTGISQIFWGIWYIFLATRKPSLIPLALKLEAGKNGLVLLSEHTFKKPTSPVPGRFAHLAVLALSLVALLFNKGSRPSS